MASQMRVLEIIDENGPVCHAILRSEFQLASRISTTVSFDSLPQNVWVGNEVFVYVTIKIRLLRCTHSLSGITVWHCSRRNISAKNYTSNYLAWRISSLAFMAYLCGIRHVWLTPTVDRHAPLSMFFVSSLTISKNSSRFGSSSFGWNRHTHFVSCHIWFENSYTHVQSLDRTVSDVLKKDFKSGFSSSVNSSSSSQLEKYLS